MTVQIPLCVNPDRTLFRTDILLETTLLFLKQRPLSAGWIPLWLLGGKCALERELAARVALDFNSLPTNHELLSFLKQERAGGRKLVLVTDACQKTAAAMAATGLFDSVISGDEPLKTDRKKNMAARLENRFGAKQYDYAGSGRGGREALNAARRTIIITASNRCVQAAKARAGVEKVILQPGPRFGDWARALRLYQWPKNLLLFTSLAGAHVWSDTARVLHLLAALAAFCLCSSSVYVLNDLLDLEADRRHPQKRRRPFAAGAIPLGLGLLAAPLLLLGSFMIAAHLPRSFLGAFTLYYALTLAYSLRLKQIAILDVLILAGLYSLRVIAGGFAAQIPVTDWLLAFSSFLFLSLAFVKRFTELQMAKQDERGAGVSGRGYLTSDAELISSMGVGCGFLSVLVLAFYINNPAVAQLYHRPAALWLACPVLLYWVSRIWLLAHRKLLHDDPIVFTLSDRQSWFVGLLFLLVAAAAAPL
jgi:4-hydroxybenzoate polyprenyltransferase